MTREKIEDIRFIVIPFAANILKGINYEGQGDSDAKEFIDDFNVIFDLAIKALEQEPSVLQDIKSELWMEGMNMAGEYQGVWVRYRDIERVIDKHISEKDK